MSQVEKSAVKSLLSMHRAYAELDEYLESQLKEAGYAGVDVQRNPVGTRITVFVTRPGLAIGRRGTGIKELTERVAQKFNLPNPQIAVSEVERPELNPRIMAQRTAQIVARGTAFRRAANWTMTTIMEAGAMGCEIGVAGKLRSDRAHKEKYRMGVVPKSGETADEIVRSATTDVLLKLGLFGIKVKIAIPDALPPPIEFLEANKDEAQAQAAAQATPAPSAQPAVVVEASPSAAVAAVTVAPPVPAPQAGPAPALAPAPATASTETEAAPKKTRAKKSTKTKVAPKKTTKKKATKEVEKNAKSESKGAETTGS
ncbi:MAG TPA: 30S ribosomal protein S3 [Nitrososphaerales archaeon]|nr:30S ribosomal protein S3 [Nitrososphaerales archaeon]HUK75796.1 30S ribosomal protein S3 [Nitrososphaerales archaeon]